MSRQVVLCFFVFFVFLFFFLFGRILLQGRDNKLVLFFFFLFFFCFL